MRNLRRIFGLGNPAPKGFFVTSWKQIQACYAVLRVETPSMNKKK